MDMKQAWEPYLHVGIKQMDHLETSKACLRRKKNLAYTLIPFQTLGFYKNLKDPQILHGHHRKKLLIIYCTLFTTKIETLLLLELSLYLNCINKIRDKENIF